uniref:Uncharacterized protein n=1 Tax=Rhizophora mucronata TaxID=61149 RepID=A0A2P2MEE4_RHIMU
MNFNGAIAKWVLYLFQENYVFSSFFQILYQHQLQDHIQNRVSNLSQQNLLSSPYFRLPAEVFKNEILLVYHTLCRNATD